MRALLFLRLFGFACALTLGAPLMLGCGSDAEDRVDDLVEGRFDRSDDGRAARGARPPQPDGEVPATGGVSRPRIPARLKAVLQSSIFWTRGDTVRIEFPGRYVWLNPVGITPATRYGADLVLLSSELPEHYSRADIEWLNDGYTTVIAPPGVHENRLEGGRRVTLAPADIAFGLADISVRALPAYTPGPDASGNERTRGHVGYHLRRGDISIYYAGPIGAMPELADMPGADICIVSVGGAGGLSGQAMIDFLHAYNPGVVVPIGHDGPEGQRALRFLARNCERPLWFPPPPREKRKRE